VQSKGKVFAAAPAPQLTARDMQRRYVLAWALCLVFYFLQYALRSAPGMMTHELSAAFGLSALGLSSILGLYYYTYAGFAIVAGAALDRYGGRLPIGIGILGVAVGSILFGLGSIAAAEAGRLLQGAGSAFAFTGAVYLAAHGFSDRWLATAVGFTQLAGMLGGFAGQFVVGPLVHGPIGWQAFWLYAGLLLVILGAATLALAPAGDGRPSGSV
jgi:MFS family permease